MKKSFQANKSHALTLLQLSHFLCIFYFFLICFIEVPSLKQLLKFSKFQHESIKTKTKTNKNKTIS